MRFPIGNYYFKSLKKMRVCKIDNLKSNRNIAGSKIIFLSNTLPEKGVMTCLWSWSQKIKPLSIRDMLLFIQWKRVLGDENKYKLIDHC